MKLFEISEQILELLAIESDGEQSLEEAIHEGLESLELDFYDKTDNIVKLIHQISADSLTIDSEIDRLRSRKVTFSNQQAGLKKYLVSEMAKIDKKSIKTPLFSLTSVAGRNKVIIDNETDIPDEYVSIKMTETPDKTALLKALADNEIKGCHIEKGDNTIRIK